MPKGLDFVQEGGYFLLSILEYENWVFQVEGSKSRRKTLKLESKVSRRLEIILVLFESDMKGECTYLFCFGLLQFLILKGYFS